MYDHESIEYVNTTTIFPHHRVYFFGSREGVRTINIPMKREISLLSDIKSLYLLWKLFAKEKPYIVHANTPKGSLLAMVAGFFAGVPNRLYTVTGL